MSNHSVLRLDSRTELPPSRDMMTKPITGKLKIFSDNALIGELPLNKPAISIGRDPQGDLLLLDPQISRQHAKLTKISSSYLIEDCSSTNGTRLNGRPVHKHIFRPGDNLQIGNFELRYVTTEETTKPADVTHAVVQPVAKSRRGGLQKGMLLFLQGPESGTVKRLKNPLFTIGRVGESVAVISRRREGIYLLHIGGDMPEINGADMTEQRVQLHHGDVVSAGEHQIKIMLH